LLKSNLAPFFLGLQGDVGFGNHQLLLVEICGNFNGGTIWCFEKCFNDRLMNPINASVADFFVDNQLLFWCHFIIFSSWERLLSWMWVGQVPTYIWAWYDWRHETF
jgi:hypothetical protein